MGHKQFFGNNVHAGCSDPSPRSQTVWLPRTNACSKSVGIQEYVLVTKSRYKTIVTKKMLVILIVFRHSIQRWFYTKYFRGRRIARIFAQTLFVLAVPLSRVLSEHSARVLELGKFRLNFFTNRKTRWNHLNQQLIVFSLKIKHTPIDTLGLICRFLQRYVLIWGKHLKMFP